MNLRQLALLALTGFVFSACQNAHVEKQAVNESAPIEDEQVVEGDDEAASKVVSHLFKVLPAKKDLPESADHYMGIAGASTAAEAPATKSIRRRPGLTVTGHKRGMRSKESRPYRPHDREEYNHIAEADFKRVGDAPLSTFSIDVDTASYANVRRLLNGGTLPPKDAVRIEEMINYFSYNYDGPTGDEAFAVNTELGVAPWNEKHRVVRIGLKGKTIPRGERPSSNLVFLLDVSGSMNSRDKLPLLKSAFKVLVNQLDARDTVSIVVYAGASGTVLEPTPGDRKSDILNALNSLRAGGSTNGGAGINLAYKLAQENFVPGGTNRIILATDGDMNVGTTSQGSLIRLVQQKAQGGVFLSVLGFGRGNLRDSTMEQIADKGNGNYAYIDGVSEARKVLGTQMGGTLLTIAKDVKIQVEFNPAKVAGYRLIGYENRVMANAHFNDDTKDAGELGAGHTVTALYELVPAGLPVPAADVDALKYQKTPTAKADPLSNELMTVKLRYKQPEGKRSRLITRAVNMPSTDKALSQDFRFASAVAAFGMLLRDSKNRGTTNYAQAIQWATGSLGDDPSGRRMELVVLMKKARDLANTLSR
jgi:Ca-activated chloride channel homolog